MNDNEIQPPTVLTADDIRALRDADWISFRHYKGQGSIDASLRADAGRIFTAREQRTYPDTKHGDRARTMYVETSMIGYALETESHEEISPGWMLAESPQAVAYASVSTPSMHDAWQTIVSMLRAGDTLTLRWVADNNTGYIRGANLHLDTMAVVIHRAEKR